jgi:Domain of unknown function (DUF397)
MSWVKSSFCSGGSCVEAKFVKSSFSLSNGTCVEVAYDRSSFCNGGNCVEVGFVSASGCTSGACVEVGGEGSNVLLRDGKLGDGSQVLAFSLDDWNRFLEAVPELDRQLS